MLHFGAPNVKLPQAYRRPTRPARPAGRLYFEFIPYKDLLLGYAALGCFGLLWAALGLTGDRDVVRDLTRKRIRHGSFGTEPDSRGLSREIWY